MTRVNAHDFEREWWGTCANTYGEETKQLVYAGLMELELRDRGGPGPTIDLERKSVLDLGGGPASLLLKTTNAERRTVVDPMSLPDWVLERYILAGIAFVPVPAETFRTYQPYTEVWIYNVLQHVRDPRQVIEVAKASAPILRLFEWIDVPPYEGHPHELKRAELEQWIGGKGTIYDLDNGGAVGTAFVFVGEHSRMPAPVEGPCDTHPIEWREYV